ncbi:MAG: hypothetical protein H8D67_31040 [Deltaproteobacteria bacterium]|nr:hypothetical protein [Deltaproteobacteria bacterium]
MSNCTVTKVACYFTGKLIPADKAVRIILVRGSVDNPLADRKQIFADPSLDKPLEVSVDDF